MQSSDNECDIRKARAIHTNKTRGISASQGMGMNRYDGARMVDWPAVQGKDIWTSLISQVETRGDTGGEVRLAQGGCRRQVCVCESVMYARYPEQRHELVLDQALS